MKNQVRTPRLFTRHARDGILSSLSMLLASSAKCRGFLLSYPDPHPYETISQAVPRTPLLYSYNIHLYWIAVDFSFFPDQVVV